MAEARNEDDEERLREPPRRRSADPSDRNKPDQRHSSQGPLSSIRAVIKRTSRTSSQSDHLRDRRRPEITILSAEPIPSNSWFPGGSGGFPPAPPPAPPTWAAATTTVQLPPPSYEQVIREKSREQNVIDPSPSSSSSSSLSSSSAHLCTTTIATQTDSHSPYPQTPAAGPVRRPPKPPRPSPPVKPSQTADEPSNSHSEECGVQTHFDDLSDDVTSFGHTPITRIQPLLDQDVEKARPIPRPRSRSSFQHLEGAHVTSTEVKVQTLVRLKDDGVQNVFAGFDEAPSGVCNKYLDELLEAFCSDKSPDPEENEKRGFVEKEDDEMQDQAVRSRPRPRPRTQRSKPNQATKPMVFEVFQSPELQQRPSKPVPMPRPLLTKNRSNGASGSSEALGSSEASEASTSPIISTSVVSPSLVASAVCGSSSPSTGSVSFVESSSGVQASSTSSTSAEIPVSSGFVASSKSARLSESTAPSVHSGSAFVSNKASSVALLDGGLTRNTPVMLTERNAGERPLLPKHTRPPPPVLRKSSSSSQVLADVCQSSDSSVPSLPPRPSGSRPLPLRPPPMKEARGFSPAPALTNQHPDSNSPKRAPPLPPRPRVGHPLFPRYPSKVPQDHDDEEEVEKTSGEEQENSKDMTLDIREEEEPLIFLDDGDVPETLSELEGQEESIRESVTVLKPVQTSKLNRSVVARFAFEGGEGELSFSEGDVIILIEYANEEWGRGLLNGQIGIFPLSFIQDEEEAEPSSRKLASASPVRSVGRVLYDFVPEGEDELQLKAGDVVCDLEEVDVEWFRGEFGGKRGFVPKNYIQLLREHQH